MELFIQGKGFHDHKGRPGMVGGSLPREESHSATALPKKYHNKTNDGGYWGNSHSQSSMITGESAETMGIEGYRVEDDERLIGNRKIYKNSSDIFLQAISDDEVGSEEILYHGFQNTRKIEFKEGDTFKIPLTATTGRMDGAASYGLRFDRADQVGQCTIFVFPEGTSMAAYQKWNNEDAADFGYKYDEAIVAGEFRVKSSILKEIDSAQHDRRPGQSWHKTSTVNIVELEPISVFDMDTGRWR